MKRKLTPHRNKIFVVYQEYENVRFSDCLLSVNQIYAMHITELRRQFPDMRLYQQNLAPLLTANLQCDIQGGTFAQVINVGLEGKSETGDHRVPEATDSLFDLF
jgi:hypothetical protein